MTKLKGLSVLCNYPDHEAEAKMPTEIEIGQLATLLIRLIHSEPEMTSFVISASVEREG